jgi:hypothetical protein
MSDRFRIEVLTDKHWLIEDRVTGETANPIDGTTNVMKGLVRSMNTLYNDKIHLEQQNAELKHKINSLLWILSQFDEKKVKELMIEMEI